MSTYSSKSKPAITEMSCEEDENTVQLFSVKDKFGFFGYIAAATRQEAREMAVKALPLSVSRADWFVVEPVSVMLSEL